MLDLVKETYDLTSLRLTVYYYGQLSSKNAIYCTLLLYGIIYIVYYYVDKNTPRNGEVLNI